MARNLPWTRCDDWNAGYARGERDEVDEDDDGTPWVRPELREKEIAND